MDEVPVRFEVANGKWERLQEVVHCKISDELAEKAAGKVLYEVVGGGERLPVASAVLDVGGEKYLSWMLEGVTEAGARRLFELAEGDERPELPVDLSVEQRNGRIAVSNQHFALSHSCRGGNWMPRGVTFNASGNRLGDIYLCDRIYNKEDGQFGLDGAPGGTARVLAANPFMAVVECKGNFCSGGKQARGNARATYRFFYTAFSPVVHVETCFEREDDARWAELHFLHLSTEKRDFERFALGEPIAFKKILPKGQKSVGGSASKWGVMDNAEDAIGVAGSVWTWDASSLFIYYLRSMVCRSWEDKVLNVSGDLYFGASDRDGVLYSHWLNRENQPRVQVLSSFSGEKTAALPPLAGSHIIEAGELKLAFDDAAHGFSLLGIEGRDGKSPRFFSGDGEQPPLWSLVFRKGTDASSEVKLSSLSVPGQFKREGDRLEFLWRGVSLGEDNGSVDVKATVDIAGRRSQWRLAVETHSASHGLWQSEFPVLGHVFDPEKGDTLVPYGNFGGTLKHNKRSTLNATYPTASTCVQFMAFMQDGMGLYYGIHDGYAQHKILNISDTQNVSFTLPAENAGEAGNGKADEFPVCIELFEGDWWTAAKIYREWALQQKWASRGPIYKNPKYSSRFAEICYWAETGGEPSYIEKRLSLLYGRVKFPIGFHWYNWNVHKFDTHYPDMRPAREGMPEVAKRLRENNIVVMPYLNGRIWDTTIDSFKTEGLACACKDEKGKPYMEVYPSSWIELSTSCPKSRIFQDKLKEVTATVVNEYNVDSIYYDQIGAARPRLCFDRSHGHPVGGGKFWVEGYRELLTRIRQELIDPRGYSITTENTAEPYMDTIDGFLPWNAREDDDVPLLMAVYGGYTQYFSTPFDSNKDSEEVFRIQQGRDFLWGVVLGWNGDYMLSPRFKSYLDFQLGLASVRYASRDFMVYGELLGDLKLLNSVPTLSRIWNYRAPHEVTVKAVQGSVWKSLDGRRCVYVLNHSDKMQVCEFEMPLPDAGKAWLVKRWTSEGSAPFLGIGSRGQVIRYNLLPGELLALSSEAYDGGQVKVGEYADPQLAEAARHYLYFAEGGPAVKVSPLVKVVPGEFSWLDIAVEAAPGAGELLLQLPDGRSLAVNASKTGLKRVEKQDLTAVKEDYVLTKLRRQGGRGELCLRTALNRLEPVSVAVNMDGQVFAGETAKALLIVANNSSTEQNVDVDLDVPQGWKLKSGTRIKVGNMKPGAKRYFSISCEIPVSDTDSVGAITPTLVKKLGRRQVNVLKYRPKYYAMQSRWLEVDGKLSDWSDCEAIQVNSKHKAKVKFKDNYGGDGDCSVAIKACWNTTYLYLAIDVKDDVHIAPSRDNNIWQGDVIQFAIRPGGPATVVGDNSNVKDFAVGYDGDGAFVYQWQRFANDGTSAGDGLMENSKVAIAKGENGNVLYEVAVPWKAFRMDAPKSGAEFGMSFVVADKDDGEKIKGYLEWTSGIFGGKSSSEFGWLILK